MDSVGRICSKNKWHENESHGTDILKRFSAEGARVKRTRLNKPMHELQSYLIFFWAKTLKNVETWTKLECFQSVFYHVMRRETAIFLPQLFKRWILTDKSIQWMSIQLTINCWFSMSRHSK